MTIFQHVAKPSVTAAAPIDNLLSTSPTDYLSSNQGRILKQEISDINPDSKIGPVSTVGFDDTTLPAADAGDYLYLTDSGTITVDGVAYPVQRGDHVRCTADDTTLGEVANWEVIPKSPVIYTKTEVQNQLTPTAQNVIPDLGVTPAAASEVKFFVNGVLDYRREISVSGQTVTVAPTFNSSYGFNIETTDTVVAVYFEELVFPVGLEEVETIEELTPPSQNTIPNLTLPPIATSPVKFFINGVLDYAGQITATGQSISVAPTINSVYGFNVETTDTITANYFA